MEQATVQKHTRASSLARTTSFGSKLGQRRREIHSFISGEEYCDGATHASAKRRAMLQKENGLSLRVPDCLVKVMLLFLLELMYKVSCTV